VTRFLAGFLCASVLWGGFLFAYKRGLVNVDLEPEDVAAEPATASGTAPDTEPDEPSGRKKKHSKPSSAHGGSKPSYSGNSQAGDELGGPAARNLDVNAAGGEEQLLSSEIEKGIDGVMSQVRRCLVLVDSDSPVTGKLVFGMRISGSGNVDAVNLQGPSVVTQSEAGTCLRNAVKSIHFRKFNGPDMVAHYPITLN
jgi:hypothetical protein